LRRGANAAAAVATEATAAARRGFSGFIGCPELPIAIKIIFKNSFAS
jgi:hypothetical protein